MTARQVSSSVPTLKQGLRVPWRRFMTLVTVLICAERFKALPNMVMCRDDSRVPIITSSSAYHSSSLQSQLTQINTLMSLGWCWRL
jgi:hypothetical protein